VPLLALQDSGAGMFEFTICSAIQGYHEYKEIWDNAIIGEELGCQ